MSPFSPSSSSCTGRTTSGCISRILRRILCFSNLPLRSFHHFNDDDKVVIESCTSTPPGLVARLMGLESLPLEETPITSSSTPRRRISSTIPAYQELEDDNFFILSFERRKPSKNSSRRTKKREKRRSRKPNNKENATVFNLDLEEIRPKIRGFEAEGGDSENSSPNSVLEFVDQQSPSSGEEISRLENSKMRRPLSDELESCGEKKVINHVHNNCADKWQQMGELAAMEMMKSSWLDQEMKKGNSLMEIGRDLELSILDQLLNEMLINLQIF